MTENEQLNEAASELGRMYARFEIMANNGYGPIILTGIADLLIRSAEQLRSLLAEADPTTRVSVDPTLPPHSMQAIADGLGIKPPTDTIPDDWTDD